MSDYDERTMLEIRKALKEGKDVEVREQKNGKLKLITSDKKVIYIE